MKPSLQQQCTAKQLSDLITKCCLNKTEQNFVSLPGLLSLWSIQNANHVVNASGQQRCTLRFSHLILGLVTFTPPANKSNDIGNS